MSMLQSNWYSPDKDKLAKLGELDAELKEVPLIIVVSGVEIDSS